MQVNAVAKIRRLFEPIDLTKGSIPKVLSRFALPIILSNILQLLYTFIDAAIIGRYCGAEEVAGVNACSILTVIILLFAMGCTSGFSVILSARIGAKDDAGVKKSFAHQVVLLAIITVILTAVAFLLIEPMLGWVGLDPTKGATAAREYEAGKTYLTVLVAGTACTTFYNMLLAVLRALGDSFMPFLILFGCVALNTGLDFLFIIPLQMGVFGGALATIIAQAIAVIAALVCALNKYKVLRLSLKDLKLEWKESYSHLKMGLPLGLQFAVIMIGFIFLQSTVVAFDTLPNGALVAGTPCQVGRTAASRVRDLLSAPLEALAIAAMSFAGQNNGAKNKDRLKKGFKVAIIMELIIWAIVTVIGLLLTINGTYIKIFLNPESISQATIDYGNTYLYTTLPLMWGLALTYLGRNYLQGLQKPLFPFLVGMNELLLRSVIPLTIPYAINGWVLNAEVANLELSYFFLCSTDWINWLVSATLLMTPTIIFLFGKNKKNGPTEAVPIEESPIVEESEPETQSL